MSSTDPGLPAPTTPRADLLGALDNPDELDALIEAEGGADDGGEAPAPATPAPAADEDEFEEVDSYIDAVDELDLETPETGAREGDEGGEEPGEEPAGEQEASWGSMDVKVYGEDRTVNFDEMSLEDRRALIQKGLAFERAQEKAKEAQRQETLNLLVEQGLVVRDPLNGGYQWAAQRQAAAPAAPAAEPQAPPALDIENDPTIKSLTERLHDGETTALPQILARQATLIEDHRQAVAKFEGEQATRRQEQAAREQREAAQIFEGACNSVLRDFMDVYAPGGDQDRDLIESVQRSAWLELMQGRPATQVAASVRAQSQRLRERLTAVAKTKAPEPSTDTSSSAKPPAKPAAARVPPAVGAAAAKRTGKGGKPGAKKELSILDDMDALGAEYLRFARSSQ